MTKELCTHGTRHLKELHWQIFDGMDEQKYGYLPPDAFLPDGLIKTILDHFHLIKDTSDVQKHVEHNPLLHGSHTHILEFCQGLQIEFKQLHQEKKSRAKNNCIPITGPQAGIIEDKENDGEAESDLNSESMDVRLDSEDPAQVPPIRVVSEVSNSSSLEDTSIVEVEEHPLGHQIPIQWCIDFS
jgi:hypothetical protein